MALSFKAHWRAAKPSNYVVTEGDKPRRGAGTLGKCLPPRKRPRRGRTKPSKRDNVAHKVARWTSMEALLVWALHYRRFLHPFGVCHRRLCENWTASPPSDDTLNERAVGCAEMLNHPARRLVRLCAARFC